MVQVARAAVEPTEIRSVAGVIVNTTDQEDGFKMHAKKLNGKRIMVNDFKEKF